LKRKFLIKKQGKSSGGFTLIEILITIGIIGILASFILIPLGGAKTKARDARVMSDLDQIRTIGEIIVSTDENYAAVNTNLDVNLMMSDMVNEGAKNIHRYSNADGYCVEAELEGGKWGCVNSGLILVFNLSDDPNCDGPGSNKRPKDINCE